MASVSFLRMFNIRKEERFIVSKLFWMQFFQGAGIAFLFPLAYSNFIYKHPVEDLAQGYIYVSVSLLLAGFIYGKLEHKYTVTVFSRNVILFMALSIFFIYLAGLGLNSQALDYFSLICYHLLYVISALEFWGLAALVFEVRQSKRLFSIISAGDIPAKFIGGTLSWGLIDRFKDSIGADILLIPSFICILCSLPFLYQIKKSGLLQSHSNQHDTAEIHFTEKNLIKTLFRKFTGNNLIFWVAILAFIMSVCMVMLNFAFYSRIKVEMKSRDQIAIFIAAFMVAVRFFALVIKLLFTSKIIANIGIKRSMLLTPLICILLVVIIIAEQNIMHNELYLLYIFGITCIVIDVFKQAVDNPVFLSIMQPLGLHDRLRAHNIVKGIMDPFAYLFVGGILLVLTYVYHGIDLIILSYVLFGFTLCWITLIFIVNRSYFYTLLKAISGKFYTQSGFSLEDADTRFYITKRLETGKPDEIIQILQVLRFQDSGIVQRETAEKLLQNPSPKVKEEILQLLTAKKVSIKETILIDYINDTSQSASLRKMAFSFICDTSENEAFIFPYAAGIEAGFKTDALAAILKNRHSSYLDAAKKIVRELISSDNDEDKIIALNAIAKAKSSAFTTEISMLMNDAEELVRSAALIAAGTIADETSVPEILLHVSSNRKVASEALLLTGDKAIPFIDRFIQSNKTTDHEKKHLITLTGRIGGHSAKTMLIKMPHHLPGHTHTMIKALYSCTDSSESELHGQLETMASKYINQAGEIVLMKKTLETPDTQFASLSDALNEELNEIRESLLYIFSMLYGKEQTEKIRRGFVLNTRESLANALELTEMIVHKKFAHDFIIIYEKVDLEYKSAHLHRIKGKPRMGQKEIIDVILQNSETSWLDWTKSCALFCIKKNNIRVKQSLIQQYLQADHPVLRETAAYNTDNAMDNKILLLEKVLILKKTAIFADTPENILADLAPLMHQSLYNEGSVIFKEGTIGDSMYIIYQGSVRIHKGNTTLAILSHENEVFGELSLFDAEKRSATATAKTDCILFKIDQLPFYELIEIRPEIISGAIKILCKRLRAQNEIMTGLTKQ